jgi:immune inhibitor A
VRQYRTARPTLFDSVYLWRGVAAPSIGRPGLRWHARIALRYNALMKRTLLSIVLLITLAGCAIEVPSQGEATPTIAIGAQARPTRASEAPATAASPTVPAVGGLLGPTPAPSEATPVSPQATPVPLALQLAELEALAEAGRIPRDQVELARLLGVCRDLAPEACPSVARTTPADVQVGDQRSFWVVDFDDDSNFQIEAELRYAGPVVLMYVENGLPYNQAALEQAAQTFEQEIYPRTRAVFGSEVQPGVDGDPRITILNARDPSGSVLGYYSSSDSIPSQINRFSNERDMFFMNAELLDFASRDYLDVLAHEFQHMIHANEQATSATWFNEGSSQLAEDLNGFFDSGFIRIYLSDPDTQLTAWGAAPGTSARHYGAAHLFMRYIYAQYAGEEQLRGLVRADAGDQVDVFVGLAADVRPDVTSFGAIVADWGVANLIDDVTVGDGRYGYATGHDLPMLLPNRARPLPVARGTTDGRVSQFGVDYLELPPGPLSLRFTGSPTVGLAGAMPEDRAAWWSGRSDNSFATLTRQVDLRGLERATLRFRAWYELENDYDYAFVSVSSDGGATWETLPGSLTTNDDPQGVNYGNGITGVSGRPDVQIEDGFRGRWVEETMDLSSYAGREVLLRFWQIADQGFNAPGILLDTIAIPELAFFDDATAGSGGWDADGFVIVDGDLPQLWELRLVRIAADGTYRVEPLPVDAQGQVTAELGSGERGVLVVVATTPQTTERARYALEVR